MKKFSSQILLHLLHLLSLSVLSWTYTLPDNYFINCGSKSNVTINSRNFVGDVSPSGSFALSAGGSSTKTNTSLSTDYDDLYQTVRIFPNPSAYEFDISSNGTYMVRLHFYPFSSLYDAIFDVGAGGFSLLSNFSAKNATNLPIIKEFLLPITVSKLEIYFEASNGSPSSIAFVNAIEAFLAPDGSVPDSATRVTISGTDTAQKSLLSEVLNPVHRINVGGAKLTPDNDTLLRTWVPDDDYLFYRGAAKNSPFYSDKPKYQDGGATEYSAPDNVYATAKEMNIDPNRQLNFFNVTWRFRVKKNTPHFVRVHFCDIISPSLNYIRFNLYIYSAYGIKINSYDIVGQLAAPFYKDFLVDSDDSGFLNISVGPRDDSMSQTAFLNGLEIMEVVMRQVSPPGLKKSREKKLLFIIIGSVAGGLGFVFLLLGVIFLLKSKKAERPGETSDWQPVILQGLGSSHSQVSPRTNGSALCNLNLGLKLSFAEIQDATNNFDPKLQIGEGGFGKVYKGTLPGGTKVAVKRSHPGHGQGYSEFQTEIIVLSRIRHRHLVSLIGYCDERYEMILVYEFMEKGTLRDHLYSRNDSIKSSPRSELTWTQRLEICIGAAEGLHYLHTSSDRGIIHRDVKSTNILLDEHYVAKVADFGLSRLGNLDQTHVSTEVKGSFGYLDPEYFGCLQLTQKSDVYSFGVVLLEVLCARPAISNSVRREEVNLAQWGLFWQRKGELEKIADPFLQGKIDPNSLRMFGETVEKCLKESGVERPSMHDVLWDLQYALQLQQTARHRGAADDSTSDPSWVLPVPSVRRLPSHSVAIDEDSDLDLVAFTDTSGSNAGEVFSQIRMEDAR